MSFKQSMDEQTRGHRSAVKRQGLLSHGQPGWISRSWRWVEERAPKVWCPLHDVLQKWRRTDPWCPGEGAGKGWPWRDSLCANRTILHHTRVVVAWRCVLKFHRTVHTHTQEHTKDSVKKSEIQRRSVLKRVVPRAVSWVSGSIVIMEDTIIRWSCNGFRRIFYTVSSTSWESKWCQSKKFKDTWYHQDFPGGSVAKTPRSQRRDLGSISGQITAKS